MAPKGALKTGMNVGSTMSPLLLVLAVAAVGVLHTLVPDHWVPIALVARQEGWSRRTTLRSAALAGTGHALSTLLIAIVVWLAGVAIAARFGNTLNLISSIGLIAFGSWIALGSLREILASDKSAREKGVGQLGHSHVHRHPGGVVHRHWHTHHVGNWHEIEGNVAFKAPEQAPMHEHEHAPRPTRLTLMLIVGSSPMVEGIPVFFAAAKFGAALLAVMSAVFAAATITTYIALVAASSRGLERLSLGPLERYGEVISGALIAALGIAFAVWSQ